MTKKLSETIAEVNYDHLVYSNDKEIITFLRLLQMAAWRKPSCHLRVCHTRFIAYIQTLQC